MIMMSLYHSIIYRDAITLCDATMLLCRVKMLLCRVNMPEGETLGTRLTIMSVLLHILKYVISYMQFYYMACITSGEMADCDWLRSTFSGPLFSRNGPTVHYPKNKRIHFETKQ